MPPQLAIDLGTILQVVIAAVLVGVGKVIYTLGVGQAVLVAEFKAHTKQDADNFRTLIEQKPKPRKRAKGKR